ETANANLRRNGIDNDRIFFAGNTMIDTLLKNDSRLMKPQIWEKAGLKEKEYFIITLHRPANVDNDSNLQALLEEILKNTRGLPVIFPVHPRTAKVLANLNFSDASLFTVEPLSYLEF